MNLFSYEAFYHRVDIVRSAAYALFLGVDIAWAYVDASNLKYFLLRLIIGAICMVSFRLALARLGTSRVSASLGAILGFLLLGDASLQQLTQLSILVGLLVLCVEFSKIPSKELALVLGIVGGGVAVLFAGHAFMILTFLTLFMGLRVLWRIALEKESRLSLLLFIAKAGVVVALSTALYWLLNDHVQSSWVDITFIPIPTVPLWLLIVGGLLALRGIWGTLLLATERSPIDRKHRMFFAFFGVMLFLIAWFVAHYGANVFTGGALADIDKTGLRFFTVQGQLGGLFALALFVTSGIDRSLYHTTALAFRLVPRNRR